MSVHTNLQDLIPILALVVCVAYTYAAKVGLNLVGLYEQTQILASVACTMGSQ